MFSLPLLPLSRSMGLDPGFTAITWQATPEEQEKARAEWKASPLPSEPLKLKLVRREVS